MTGGLVQVLAVAAEHYRYSLLLPNAMSILRAFCSFSRELNNAVGILKSFLNLLYTKTQSFQRTRAIWRIRESATASRKVAQGR
jgi:hypothetical protein